MEEMRRKDREVTELETVKEIIRQCDVLRLGLADGDYPYIVPMNFGWEEKGGRLYFYLHGASEGRKAELLRPRIAPGDVMLGDTEVDKSCAELLGLPWIVLDRGFRSAVYWQAHGVQPAHDLHEAARRLQNLP